MKEKLKKMATMCALCLGMLTVGLLHPKDAKASTCESSYNDLPDSVKSDLYPIRYKFKFMLHHIYTSKQTPTLFEGASGGHIIHDSPTHLFYKTTMTYSQASPWYELHIDPQQGQTTKHKRITLIYDKKESVFVLIPDTNKYYHIRYCDSV